MSKIVRLAGIAVILAVPVAAIILFSSGYHSLDMALGLALGFFTLEPLGIGLYFLSYKF